MPPPGADDGSIVGGGSTPDWFPDGLPARPSGRRFVLAADRAEDGRHARLDAAREILLLELRHDLLADDLRAEPVRQRALQSVADLDADLAVLGRHEQQSAVVAPLLSGPQGLGAGPTVEDQREGAITNPLGPWRRHAGSRDSEGLRSAEDSRLTVQRLDGFRSDRQTPSGLVESDHGWQ